MACIGSGAYIRATSRTILAGLMLCVAVLGVLGTGGVAAIGGGCGTAGRTRAGALVLGGAVIRPTTVGIAVTGTGSDVCTTGSTVVRPGTS